MNGYRLGVEARQVIVQDVRRKGSGSMDIEIGLDPGEYVGEEGRRSIHPGLK